MNITTLVSALALALAAPMSSAVDPALVQVAWVYELNVASAANGAGACKVVLDKDGRLCGGVTSAIGRRFELKGLERRRALQLVNDNVKAPPRGCPTAPTHAFVFTTTQGTRAVDVSFACHTIGGRLMGKPVEKDVDSFFRGFGLVHGLIAPRSL